MAKNGLKSRVSSAEDRRDREAVEPSPELVTDGRIRAALDMVLASPQRNARGQFVRGILKTGEHSEAFWVALEPVKADIVTRVRAQLAIEHDDGRETLSGLIDAYAEARLLRQSAFLRMCQQGGPVTRKGKGSRTAAGLGGIL